MLRQRPSYLGSGTESVTYGMRLSVLAEQGPWRMVATQDGRQGWLHISALSEKRLRMQSGEADVATGADLDEIALAGKGFTEEVEQAFKENNEDVDFIWVDRMSGWVVTPQEAAAFLAAGEIEPREGGER
jgi:SH3-like domain-containing protein